MGREPPHITFNHREYEQLLPNTTKEEDTTTIVHKSFFFTHSHIATIRRLVPLNLRQCTDFDLITACFWYCHTKAMQLEPNEDVRIMCVVNARSMFKKINRSSLVGYYGNCFAFPAAVTTAGKLCGNSLGYAVELIRNAKSKVTEEYMYSVADLMSIKERCLYTTVRSCFVSDLTRAKFVEVDFGWGEAVYGSVAKGGIESFPGTFIVPYKNAKGEKGLLLPICLPYQAMKSFSKELGEILNSGPSVNSSL